MKNNFTEHAVSPVVGVMLMLVVTIIVAALVSSFGTGLTGGVDTASNARVELVGVSSGGGQKGTYEQIGIVFKNAGGGSLDLRNLKLYIAGLGTSPEGVFSLTYNDPVSLRYVEGSPYVKSGQARGLVLPPKEATGYRMQKFGSGLTPEEMQDPIVEPGDRFIIYSEYYDPGKQWLGLRADRVVDPDYPNPDAGGNTWSSGAIAINGGSYYTLSDIKTGVVYSEGYLEPEHLF